MYKRQGLDPKGRDEILDRIAELHKKKHMTIILVSHSMEDMARYADRIIVMNQGEKAFDGSPREVFSHYKELEKMGLIYPVKGRGNFVADSSQVQKINRESYRKEFTALIQKGRNTGFNREELDKMFAEIFEKEDES